MLRALFLALFLFAAARRRGAGSGLPGRRPPAGFRSHRQGGRTAPWIRASSVRRPPRWCAAAASERVLRARSSRCSPPPGLPSSRPNRRGSPRTSTPSARSGRSTRPAATPSRRGALTGADGAPVDWSVFDERNAYWDLLFAMASDFLVYGVHAELYTPGRTEQVGCGLVPGRRSLGAGPPRGRQCRRRRAGGAGRLSRAASATRRSARRAATWRSISPSTPVPARPIPDYLGLTLADIQRGLAASSTSISTAPARARCSPPTRWPSCGDTEPCWLSSRRPSGSTRARPARRAAPRRRLPRRRASWPEPPAGSTPRRSKGSCISRRSWRPSMPNASPCSAAGPGRNRRSSCSPAIPTPGWRPRRSTPTRWTMPRATCGSCRASTACCVRAT